MNENQTNFFVITGDPGVGKTSLINELSKRNFQVVDEDAREIIRNQMHQNGDALPWKNKELYAKFILEASIKSYENFISLKTSKPIFFDRGILDTISYMKMESLVITDEILKKLKRYKYNQKVFILPPCEEIYSTDEERKQDCKEAEKTYQFMLETYQEFGYEVIEFPKKSVELRADFVINQIIKMRIISIRENPDYKNIAIKYIQNSWSEVAPIIYENCIENCIGAEQNLPQWYLLEVDNEIVGCAGLIPNDFNSRMDLYPWLCALYIDEKHRGKNYANLLIDQAKKDTKAFDFKSLYLCTDFSGYYEKFGFEYIGQTYHPWEEETRVYQLQV